MVQHRRLYCEESLNIFGSKRIKCITVVFNCCVLFFFSFFDFKLFLIHFFGLSLSWFTSICRFSLSFLFRNFSLFKPFFNQITLIKHYKPIFRILDFESNSKCLFFGSLRFSNEVSDVFIEAIHTWLIFNQNFNCFLS